jgi:hypothetical protein
MLKFNSKDKELLIWINGMTKKPETLTQDELAQLRKNGDVRVSDTDSVPAAKPAEREAASQIAPKP